MFLLFYTLLEDDGAGCSRDTFRSIISEGFFRSIGMLLNLDTSLLHEAFKFCWFGESCSYDMVASVAQLL